MSLARFGISTMLLLSILISGGPACAQNASEYKLKAAFLYNFTLYTEWPEHVADDFMLCVYGDSLFEDHLEPLQGKTVNQRTFRIDYRDEANSLKNCQLVFLSQSQRRNVARVVEKLNGLPILLVSDIEDSTDDGVMISMFESDGRIAFKANLLAAERCGLKLSSKMLRLASEVIQ